MRLKRLVCLAAAILLMLTSCGGKIMELTYKQISQEEAKKMMDQYADAIILDVREAEEFAAGHIKGAVLLSVGSITEESAAEVIGEKDTMVLIYCRSGNRSKTASAKLAALGYSNVYEFGGINTWPYEIEK